MGKCMIAVLVVLVVCSSSTWADAYAAGSTWTVFPTAGGELLEVFGVQPRLARAIVSLLVASLATTTLVSGMRLQFFVVGELGMIVERSAPVVHKVSQNRHFQIVVSAVPSIYVANSSATDVVWNLFGATDLLAASVSMIVALVYVQRYRKWDFVKQWSTGALFCSPACPLFIVTGFLVFTSLWGLVQVMDWCARQSEVLGLMLAMLTFFLASAVFAPMIWVINNRSKRSAGFQSTSGLPKVAGFP